MEKMFCPHCGNEIEKGTQFCGNCGYNVEEYLKKQADTQSKNDQTNNAQTGEHRQRSTQKAPKKPMSQKTKISWIVGVVVVVLLIGGYMFGKNYYSADKQLDRIVTALSSDGDLAKYATTDDPSMKINDKNLQPTQKYFKTHKAQLAKFKSSMRNTGSYQNFELKQDGKYLLLFPKYKLNITPAYVTLHTNHAGVKFYQGNKKLATATSDKKSYKAGPYAPGTYSFKTKGTISGNKMQNSATRDLTKSSDDIQMDLKTVSFTIKGFPGSEVYLNDEKLGKIGNTGKYRVTDKPEKGNMEVHLEYKVNDKAVSSKTVNVVKKLTEAQYYGTPSAITPKFEGVISKSDAQTLFENAFIDAQNQSDDAADSFKDGQNNKDFNELYEMSKAFDDDDDIYTFDYEVDVKSVAPGENGTSAVNFQVKFNFDKEDERKVQVFSYPGVVSKDGDDYVINKLGGATKVSEKVY